MTSRRYLPAIFLLFVGSGCAALIYEIVWLQLLSLIIGSSAVSMAVLLGTFMGGMCLGSLFLSKYVSRAQHPQPSEDEGASLPHRSCSKISG